MPKAQQGHGGTAACELGQRGIPPDGGKDNARRHVSGQDAGRGQAGQVDEQLPRRADGSAHAERPEIIHVLSPFCGARSSTRWATAGMLSFCKKVVWLIRAPVATNSTRF